MYTITANSTATNLLPPQPSGTLDTEKILSLVADAFGIASSTITSKTRKHDVVMARWMFWLILRCQGYTQVKCGDLTGGYNHSSVIHAYKQIYNDIVYDTIMRKGYELLSYMLPESEQMMINKRIQDFENRISSIKIEQH